MSERRQPHGEIRRCAEEARIQMLGTIAGGEVTVAQLFKDAEDTGMPLEAIRTATWEVLGTPGIDLHAGTITPTSKFDLEAALAQPLFNS